MYSRQTMNTSNDALEMQRIPSLPTQGDQLKVYRRQSKETRVERNKLLEHENYAPAQYQTAVRFRDSMSYKKKIDLYQYKQIQLFEDTAELKVFGLGPYFFIQFQRRIVWLFLVLSLLQGVRIYICLSGTGLNIYKGSFGTFLISMTLGNFDRNAISSWDLLIVFIVPFLIYVLFSGFYVWWKFHYLDAIKTEEMANQYVKPQKFCLQIEGFSENKIVREQQLQSLFSVFGPIYEVSLAREYAGNLKYFEEQVQLEEQIKEEELQIVLGSGDTQKQAKLKRKYEQLDRKIKMLSIKASVRSAYIHFQFQKSKEDMLEYFNEYYLFSGQLSHKLIRSLCACCIDEDTTPKYMYKGNMIKIKSQKVPEPEDINWQSYDVGLCSKILRVISACLIILVFFVVSCAIIGLCSIYITSNSISCEDMLIPDTVAAASASITTDRQKKCFCNSKFVDSFTDDQIKVYCGELLNQVYVEQGIQYAVTVTSTVVNIIFGLLVHKIVNITQPLSFSTGFLWRTTIYTIFLIINTVFLPLLIYADIFGFKAAQYISFVTIASTDIRNLLKVDQIRFAVDFEKIWYRNVSPIFINYIILDIIITWVFFAVNKMLCTKEGLREKEGKILQKKMNEQITSWKLSVSSEYADFNLIIFMAMLYSSGMPIIIPFGFISLFSKYLSNRILLQSQSSRIEGLSQNFNALPLVLLPLSAILSCLVGQWMLTGNTIVSQFDKLKVAVPFNFYVLERSLQISIFFFLAALVLTYFLFYNILGRFFNWIGQSCFNKKAVVHPYHTREFSHHLKSMNINSSYNIKKNPKFSKVVANLQAYLKNNQTSKYEI